MAASWISGFVRHASLNMAPVLEPTSQEFAAKVKHSPGLATALSATMGHLSATATDLLVLASVLVFGLTLGVAGLVVSTILLVLVASTASHEYRRMESVMAAVALAVFVVIAFHYGLDLQLSTLPPALFD